MTGYLRVIYFKDFGNFSNDWIFGKFSKNLGIWEIPQMPGIFGKFFNYPDIWGISQMPGYLGIFQSFEKFPKS